jgi:hypothetical protein
LKNATVKANLDSLSTSPNVLKHATDISQIDTARAHHRSIEDSLKGFETSSRRIKELHNQALRTKRAWSKVCSNERRFIKEHVKSIIQEHSVAEGRQTIKIQMSLNFIL